MLVIDKPPGMTSRAVVDRLQRCFPRGTKIGHTGTLDPLATGVLVICVGAATRLTEYLQRMTKTYRAGIRLGSRSDTDDSEGTVSAVEGTVAPYRDAVERCLASFIGDIDQIPPAYSAAKLNGRRAYELARRGQEVMLGRRRIRIGQIDVISYDFPHLEIEVQCGKGTYIRSLARDLGEMLGCGGLIESLRRTSVGPFAPKDALALDSGCVAIRSKLLPLLQSIPNLATVSLDEAQLRKFRQGLPVPAHVAAALEDDVAVLNTEGELAALARYDRASGLLHPKKVIVL
jgi:tRNA pseudouridine55 synthase